MVKSGAFDNLNSKNFPLNSELEAFLTFRGIAKGSWLRSVSPDFETFSVRTRHSFVKLPDGGYKPRKFDPRAGYGAMTFYDYAKVSESYKQYTNKVKHIILYSLLFQRINFI